MPIIGGSIVAVSDSNGLAEAGAIIRIGRKVLIDLDAFEAWLDSRASSH